MSARRRAASLAPLAVAFAALAIPTAARAAAPRRGPDLVVVPVCPGPLCKDDPGVVEHARGKRIIWLVFDGIELSRSQTSDDATQNKSAIVRQSMAIPAFSKSSLYNDGGRSTEEIVASTIEELESIFAPYDVEFVTERPASGNYSAIVFGGSCASVVGFDNCGGIALMDCSDTMPNNITFVFPLGLDYRDLAPTAAQESAHAFGLAHTNDDADVMYPVIQSGVYPDHFGDTDARCCDSTAVAEGDCYQNEVQQGGTCGRSRQNSHEVMLSVIGPRGQDVYGPDTVITSHTDGDTINPGDTITAEASDEAGVTKVELLIGNTPRAETTSAPYAFAFPDDVPKGQVLVRVRSTDGRNNQTYADVSLYQPGDDDPTCDDDDDCADGSECNGEYCVPDNGVNELGEVCGGNGDCSTDACGTVDGESRCTQACTAATGCPDGFECRGDDAGACWPSDGDGGGCGCRTADASGVPGLLALLGVALLAGRRRRLR